MAETIYRPFLLLLFLLMSVPLLPPAVYGSGWPPFETASFRQGSEDLCSSPEDCLSLAVARLGEGDRSTARRLLEDLNKRDPRGVWGARASFLLALTAMHRNDPEGKRFFDRAMELSDIEDYVIFYKAGYIARMGDVREAVGLYERVVSKHPGSVLAPEAMLERAKLLMEEGDYKEAAADFNEVVRSRGDDELKSAALLGMSVCYDKSGDYKEATEALERLVSEYPASKEAEEGLRRLKIYRSTGRAPSELEPAKRYLRGLRLLKAGRAGEAAGEFASLIDVKGYSGDAAIKLAAAETRLGRTSKAISTLKRFLNKGPDREHTLKALGLLSRIALRRGDEGLFIYVEKRLSKRFPKSRELAMLKIYRGRVNESRGRTEEAFKSYREVLDGRFEDQGAIKEALWGMGWLHYRRGSYSEAQKYFLKGASLQYRRGTERFIYWAARSAERLGRIEEAGAGYRSLCGGIVKSYYCRMAKERLAALGLKVKGDEQHKRDGDFSSQIPESTGGAEKLLSDPGYRRAVELVTLGLGSYAADEIEPLEERYNDDPEALLMLTGLLYRAGAYNRVLRMLDRYMPELVKARHSGITIELEKFAFPRPIVDFIRKNTDDLSVDPYLVAAVMREESAFDTKVVSGAGAVGLMQIIPETGLFVAKSLGHKPFDTRELFDPETNLRFGAWYLGHLAERFGGDPVLTIAGYNAGPGAVLRWSHKRAKPLDEFIESIPYPETRAYTKRVLRSYAGFLELSGRNAKKLFSRPGPRIAGSARTRAVAASAGPP